jgi:hypothetical protein
MTNIRSDHPQPASLCHQCGKCAKPSDWALPPTEKFLGGVWGVGELALEDLLLAATEQCGTS